MKDQEKIKEQLLKSDRKIAEKALQESNSLLSSILESPDNIIMFALDTNYNYLNFNKAHEKEMKNIYGADIKIGQPILDYIPNDDDRLKVVKSYKRVLKGERFIETQQYGLSNSRLWYELIFNPIIDISNNVTGLTVFITNITERKLSEKAFANLSIQNKLILESAAEGIYGLDLDGNTTFVNPAAAKMIGWNVKDILGKSQHDLLHHTKVDGTIYDKEECPIYASYKDGKVHHINDEVFWRKDGSSFPVEYSSTPIRNDQGELAGAVVTFRDITERMQAEIELKNHREHLEELVEERTTALEEKNKKLDDAMKVFVGREQKIKQLQDKIKAMEQK